MVNTQVLQGQWNQVRGQLKKKWGQLTDDDLRFNNGNIDQLVGKIQHKTGEAREAIEQYLDELTSQGDRPFPRCRGSLPGGGDGRPVWPLRGGSGARRLQPDLRPVRPAVRLVTGNDPRQSGSVGRHGVRRRHRARRRGRPGTSVSLNRVAFYTEVPV